jgi:hypothetical protein
MRSVVAGGDQELAGDLNADSVHVDQVWRRGPDQRLDLTVERLDLLVQGLPPAGQVPQGRLHRGQEQPVGIVDQSEQLAAVWTQPQTAVDQGSLGQDHQLVPQRRGRTDHHPP